MKFNKEIFDDCFFRNLFVVLGGVAFYFLILNLEFLSSQTTWIFSLFRPFILGFVFAFLLSGLLSFLEKKFLFKIKNVNKKRITGVFLTMIITLGVTIVLFWLLLPQLARSLGMLLTKVPEYLQNLQEFLIAFLPEITVNTEQTNKMVMDFFGQNVPKLFSYSGQVVNGLMHVILGVIIAVYFLFNKELYWQQFRKVMRAIFPEKAARKILHILNYGQETFTNFFYGKLLDSLIVGVICFIGLAILQIPYALLISVIICVTNIVPFFGPFIGAIPTILLVLAVDPMKALWFGIFIIVLQQFDGNILGPKILGNSIGLPPIWVMFAILIGGGMFGFPGMILGIPVFAMIYKLIREKVNASDTTKFSS